MPAGDHQDPIDGGVDDEYPGEKEMPPASHRQPLGTRQGHPGGKRPDRPLGGFARYPQYSGGVEVVRANAR